MLLRTRGGPLFDYPFESGGFRLDCQVGPSCIVQNNYSTKASDKEFGYKCEKNGLELSHKLHNKYNSGYWLKSLPAYHFFSRDASVTTLVQFKGNACAIIIMRTYIGYYDGYWFEICSTGKCSLSRYDANEVMLSQGSVPKKSQYVITVSAVSSTMTLNIDGKSIFSATDYEYTNSDDIALLISDGPGDINFNNFTLTSIN